MGKNIKKLSTPRITKFQATLLVLICLFAIIHTCRFVLKKMIISGRTLASARSIGNPQAKIKISEYLDFQCPACAKGGLLLKDYVNKFPSQIYLEVHYFPIQSIHEFAVESATYAECASRQNKFFPFVEKLLIRQQEWAKALRPESIFQDIAKTVGLDLDQLDACMKDEDVSLVIYREKAEGKSLGIESTPTYFVNGKIIVGYKALLDELQKSLGGLSDQK